MTTKRTPSGTTERVGHDGLDKSSTKSKRGHLADQRPPLTYPSVPKRCYLVKEPPDGLGEAGMALWGGVAGRFDLDPHEVVLLREAARTADLCADLAARVDWDGLTLPWGEDRVRAHPLLARLESSRALLARLIAALRIPEDDEVGGVANRRRRAYRGFYGRRSA